MKCKMKKIITLLIVSSLAYFSFGQHPNNLQATNLTSNSADLSWGESIFTNGVYLKYRIIGSGSAGWINWNSEISSPYSLNNLTPTTSYELYVKFVGASEWSNASFFSTLDDSNCNLSTSVVINNSSCDGSYDGSASITAFNGTPPYSYLWDNNNTTSSLNSITNNTYIITTTDSLSCFKIDTILVEFDNLISLSQSISVFTDTSRLEFPNTLESYQSWAYDTLRLFNNGCNINIRPEFIISHQNMPIQLGQITIQWQSPFGFTTIPYNINNNGEAYGFFNTGVSDSTGINALMGSTNEILLRVKFQGQAPYGTYSAIWNTKEVDDFGNIIQTVTENDTTTLTLVNCNSFQSHISQSNISCWGYSDGITSIDSIINGSGNYTYEWVNVIDQTITLSTNNSIYNLSQGNYSCTTIDSNWGCSLTNNISISEPSSVNSNIDSTSNISNYGGNNGFIYITTNGGSGLLNTNWTSANSYSSTSNDILNLYTDIYYLEVTDTNSCTYLDTVELSQPSSLWMSIDNTVSPSCYEYCNGAINITADGGDSTYSYSWTGPDGFISNNNNINNLCNGEYIIILDDGITILIDTISIYQPQPITTLLSVDSIACHNGTAQAEINAWGGSQPFTYSWSNGDTNYYTIVNSGNHSIDISDINGCTYAHSFSLTDPDSIFTQTTSTSTSCFGGNNGTISINITNGGISPYNFSNDNGLNYQISSTFTNLLAGNYSFLISDINGCLGSASAEVIEPSAIISTTTAIDASCFSYCNGSVTATALGGTSPYSYIWANGSSNLCAGFYNVIVTDLNGCIGSNSAIVNEPNPLLINVWIDGSNIIATSGFTSYQWYDNNNDPINGANDSIFTPSSIGVYYVTVTDTNACSADSYYIEYTISTIEDYTLNINIFPNPTNGNITINSLYGIKTIKLYNSIGNELYSVNNKENSITETKIDLSTFAKGVYFIKININNQIINQRIILQ